MSKKSYPESMPVARSAEDVYGEYPKFFSAQCPICTHSVTLSAYSPDDEAQKRGSFTQVDCPYCRDKVNAVNMQQIDREEYYKTGYSSYNTSSGKPW